MRIAGHRSLVLLCAAAALTLASCAGQPERDGPGVGSKLSPDNHVFDVENQGLKLLWPYELGRLTGTRALRTIYIAGRFVIVEAEGGEIHCLDAQTGEWKATTVLGRQLQVPPTAIGDKLVFVVRNSIVIYDTVTRKTSRPYRPGFALTAAPLLQGSGLLLAGGDGNLARLSLTDARQQWLASLRGPIREQPIVAGGRLFAVSPAGVLAWDLAQGTMLGTWAPQPPSKLSSGLAVVAGSLYVGDSRGLLYALDPGLPAAVWQRMLGAPVIGTPTAAGTRLLVLTSEPNLICIDAVGERKELWRVQGVVKLLTLGKDRAYTLNDDGSIAALSLETGKELWRDPLPADCTVVGSRNRPAFYIANPRGSVVGFAELD